MSKRHLVCLMDTGGYLRACLPAFMFSRMKIYALALFALFFVGCSEAIGPDWEPKPTCALPEATWSIDADGNVECGPGSVTGPDNGLRCVWDCASYEGVCGTRVVLWNHLADPFASYDAEPDYQCHSNPGVDADIQAQPAASLAD